MPQDQAADLDLLSCDGSFDEGHGTSSVAPRGSPQQVPAPSSAPGAAPAAAVVVSGPAVVGPFATALPDGTPVTSIEQRLPNCTGRARQNYVRENYLMTGGVWASYFAKDAAGNN
eukprot:1690430-Pyramimonas_sp.AAC.1